MEDPQSESEDEYVHDPEPMDPVYDQPRSGVREIDVVYRYEDVCPICLCEFAGAVGKLECTHVFHQKCLSAWFSESNTCPMCRK